MAAARAEVGSALQGLDMQRRLTIVQELVDRAPPEDIAFDSEDMSNYTNGIIATLCDVAGVRLGKDKLDDITKAYDKFFALVAKGIARPNDFLQLERVMDILRRLDALQNTGNRTSLMNVVATACELARTMAQDCDELRNSASNVVDDYITEIASGIKALNARAAATIKDCEPKQKILQSAAAWSEAALVIQKAYEKSRSDALLASLVVAVKGVTDIGGAYLGVGPAWHAGVTGDGDRDLKKLSDLATEIYKHFDVKALDANLATLRSTAAACQDIMDLKDSERVTQAKAMVLKATALLVELQFIWHIMNEHNKEILRSKVVAEVKRLRSLGVKEKGYMHRAAFLYSNAILLGEAPKKNRRA